MELSLMNWIMLLTAVFFAGFVDSIAGGGGLISIPAYLAVGLPPHLAAGTNKLSACAGTAFATFRFLKSGRFNLPAILSSIPLALAGSAFGSELALHLDSTYFKYCLVGILPVITVFMLIKKNHNSDDRTYLLTPKRIIILSAISALAIGIYDGFLGPGTGTFLILAHSGLIGFGLVTASGNAKVVNLATNMAALAIFLFNNQVDLLIGMSAAICGIVGNWLGSGLAIRNGSKIIRPIFIFVIVLLTAKIVIDLFRD